MPPSFPDYDRTGIDQVLALVDKTRSGDIEPVLNWSTFHYTLYFDNIYPLKDLNLQDIAIFLKIDTLLSNAEIACVWFKLCIKNSCYD